jgi:hypothetical protein
VKTDDLVSLLAAGTAAVDAHALRRRALAGLAAGSLAAAALMFTWLGVNPFFGEMPGQPMFWVREAFCAALAAGGVLVVARLGRPGATLGQLPLLLALPVLAMWVLGAVVLVGAPPAERSALIRGVSWTVCSANIVALSIPVFVAVVAWQRRLAPTMLRRAGAAAGFAAGAIGALVYTLHCPELEAPFLGLWYVLGMLVPAAAGALLGPRLLRW